MAVLQAQGTKIRPLDSPTCQAIVDDDAPFCSRCGLDLPVPLIAEAPEREQSLQVVEEPEPVPQVKPPSTDIWEMPDLAPHTDSDRKIAPFTLRTTDPSTVAREMDLPAYPGERTAGRGVANGLCCYALNPYTSDTPYGPTPVHPVFGPREDWNVVRCAIGSVQCVRLHPVLGPGED